MTLPSFLNARTAREKRLIPVAVATMIGFIVTIIALDLRNSLHAAKCLAYLNIATLAGAFVCAWGWDGKWR